MTQSWARELSWIRHTRPLYVRSELCSRSSAISVLPLSEETIDFRATGVSTNVNGVDSKVAIGAGGEDTKREDGGAVA